MRPTTHEVKLERGAFVVPLTFDTFRRINSAPLDPRDPADPRLGFVDSNAIILGVVQTGRDPHPLVALRIIHEALGSQSPGMAQLAVMDNQRNLILAAVELCSRVTVAMAPEKPAGGTGPKE